MNALVKVLIVLVVIGVAGVASGRVNVGEFMRAGKDNPYAKSSPMHEPWETVNAKLKANTRITAQLKTAKSGAEAFRVGDKLVQQGISRLDDGSLVKLTRLTVDILDQMEDKACGRVLKGGFSSGRQGVVVERLVSGGKSPMFHFLDALEAVGPEKGGAYLDLVYVALEKAVEQPVLPSDVDPSDAQHAIGTLLASRFTAEQRDAILGTLSRGPKAGDEELCLAVRALYANINVTAMSQRRIILRYLASNT